MELPASEVTFLTNSTSITSRLTGDRLPLVMGILNVTPDSFSDGGQLYNSSGLVRDEILHRALTMIDNGVDILDVGGESTRPGAKPVNEQQELDRVIPVLEWLAEETDIPVSVDTSSPMVMREAIGKGAALINDVRALRREGALEVVAQSGLPVCLMHMLDEPGMMQSQPCYENVVDEICEFLKDRVEHCLAAGISRSQIIIDPGFGFGKTQAHNLALFNGLEKLVQLGYPLLVGVSRKSMIGNIIEKPVDQRLAGSLALAILAAQRGATILRVHDVADTVDALKIWRAVEK